MSDTDRKREAVKIKDEYLRAVARLHFSRQDLALDAPRVVPMDKPKVSVIMAGLKHDDKASYDALRDEYSGELDALYARHKAGVAKGLEYLAKYL